LPRPPSDLIGSEWIALDGAGAPIASRNPAHPAKVVWSGVPNVAHVDRAIEAARKAFPQWAAMPREKRFEGLLAFKKLCEARADAIASLICDETGKALWDAKQEAGALAAKVDITLDASPIGPLSRVSGFETPLAPTRAGKCWFRPHGVMAVIGPFNFPAHLPNGHIVPALAMGNTIVLKPSDKAPAVGQLLIELFKEALDSIGAPAGVVNLVQGGADIAGTLVAHEGIDGVLFTGSWPVGKRIMQANLDRPARVLALEMGGNNAAVVLVGADLKQAAIECGRSAFVTTGQRCTCTRRVVVQRAIADRFIDALKNIGEKLVIADPRSTSPVFMGPIISGPARDAVLAAQDRMEKAGGKVALRARAIENESGGFYISPCIIRVDRFVAREDGSAGKDVEVFGPLLRVCVVDSLDDAIEQANATRFGLAASIFTKDASAIEQFLALARAGCVNVNTGTAGASSKLPFGGLGLSGNHRPAGSFSLDYCAYPVAGMIESGAAAPIPPGMAFDDAWVR
jgi:succinylglutamic semialdehyde dehydrogenase